MEHFKKKRQGIMYVCQTIHDHLGIFFKTHTGIGAFVYVLSLISVVTLGIITLLFGGVFVQLAGVSITTFILLKPLWVSILLFPVFLYLIDRSSQGAGR